MTVRPFIQCDVFSPYPARGNALAVVLDAQGLDDVQMQRFAAWTNLAETTFVLPPEDTGADYRVRIFTPTREMPFAGHPTLGSCAAWLATGGTPRDAGVIRQECGVGIVEVHRGEDDLLAFRAPPTTIRPMQADRREAILERLGVSPSVVRNAAELDNGPVWQAFELASAADVLALDSSRVRWPEFKALGFFGAHPEMHECDHEVRMLAPSSGMSEDPITGSLNAALAHWLRAQGRLGSPLVIAQGGCIERAGRVFVRPRGDDVYIAGHTVILVRGEIEL